MSVLKSPLFVGAAVFTVLVSTSLSSPLYAEPLGAAVESALNNHPSIEAALATRDAAREEKREYFAGYFPQIDARTAGGRVYGDNATSRGLSVTRGSGYSWLWEGSLSVTQMLFDGFETPARVGAAQARREAANYDVVDVREQLALRTVLSYLDVLRGREALSSLKGHRETVESYLSRINEMVEQGGAEEAMAVQARDIAAQLDAALASLEGELKTSEIDYREIVGHLPDAEMVRPVPKADVIPELPGDAVAYAKENHPTLLSLSQVAQASKYDIRAEKAAFYPDFNGEVSILERDQDDVIGGEVVDKKAVVRMSWNFSTGGAQVARVKKARYQRQESLARQEEMARQIESLVRTAYSDRDTAINQLKVMGERVSLNTDLLKTYEAQFEAARVNLLQLMQTENSLFNTKLSHLNGDYRFLAAQFSVLASMGKLQEALMVVPAK